MASPIVCLGLISVTLTVKLDLVTAITVIDATVGVVIDEDGNFFVGCNDGDCVGNGIVGCNDGNNVGNGNSGRNNGDCVGN